MVMEAVGAAATLTGALTLNTPVKAKLQVVGVAAPEGERTSLEVMFNPTTYQVLQTAAVAYAPNVTSPGGTAAYTGTSEITLTCDLLFDAFKEFEGDVTGPINTILNWMRPDPRNTPPPTAAGSSSSSSGGGGGAATPANPMPPRVKFVWGNKYLDNFEGYITKANVTYKLFRKDGTPVRATVALEIKGTLVSAPPTNPTSHAIGSSRVHTLTEGDTLQSVAFRELGRPAHWRAIAEANGIDDPQRVSAGRRLLIPTANSLRGSR